MSRLRVALVFFVSSFVAACGCGNDKLKPSYQPDVPDSGPVTCAPQAETCNGRDDDCNGAIDDGLGTLRCGVGACAREVPSCVTGQAQRCIPGAPTPETCNGLDDDCNGAVDENLAPHACGVGECAVVQASCDQGTPLACMPGTPGVEVCNRKDDDCDGTVDEDLLTNTAGDRRLTDDPASSDYVYISGGGPGFGVVWQDKRATANGQIFFAPVDAQGARTGADVRVSNTQGVSTHPAVAWSGTRWGLVYADDASGVEQLYFRALGPTGTPQAAAVKLATSTASSDWPDVVWTGSAFAVAYDDQRAGANQHDIYFQRLDTDGQRLGGEIRVTTDPGRQSSPVLKWNGSEFGLVWTDYRFAPNREVYFRRLAADGQPLGAEVRVTNDTADSAWPDLAWNDLDREWAVVWHDSRDGNAEVYFARLDAQGGRAGPDVRLTSAGGFSGYASIDWNGYQYGVSWQDDRAAANKPAIYFAQVSAQGRKNGGDLKLSNGSGSSSFTTALWNGSTFAFCWRDDRDGNTEIYFASVGCPN
ncbi:MAG: MopE-related protein [Myxococcota bacterium]